LVAVSGGLSTSRFGVKAVEELDGGMKAVAVLEYALDTQTSSTVGAARQEMLALAGDFGTFATGYLQTTGYDFGAKFDPFAGSSVSALQNMTKGNAQFLVGVNAGATRASRALAYISPSMGGVTVALNYSTALADALGNLTVASGAAETKVTAMLASATYANGPLAVGGVYAKTKNPSATSTSDETELALGGSFDLGVAKLSGTFQTTKNGASGTAGNANKILSFSGVVPVGSGAIAASLAKASIGTATNGDGTGISVGYLHSLSKTVTAYGALCRVSNGSATKAFSVFNSGVAGGTSTNGASSTLIAVGLKKVF
jgi:predicted porin